MHLKMMVPFSIQEHILVHLEIMVRSLFFTIKMCWSDTSLFFHKISQWYPVLYTCTPISMDTVTHQQQEMVTWYP